MTCQHAYGELLDDCVLQTDPVTGKMRCWAHPAPPIPRQRSDAEDRLARLQQGQRWSG